MFLPNLQKNIQELERQISRLETECEHMGRREMVPGSPPSAKATVKESTNQPFITGPSISAATYSAKMVNLAASDVVGLANPRQNSKSPGDLQNVRFNESLKPLEKKPKTAGEDGRVEPHCSSRNVHDKKTPDSSGEQKRNVCDREAKNLCERSKQSKREVSESSDDSRFPQLKITGRGKNKLKDAPKDPTWRDLLESVIATELDQETGPNSKSLCKTKFKEVNDPVLNAAKDFSDEDSCVGGHSSLGGKVPSEMGSMECDAEAAPRNKRRSRSVRTKKNFPEELSVRETNTKSLQEKEIQCLLWNEEKGKGEFFLNVNQSIRILQGLIEELKKKTTQEKRNDVLNDMQNTLKKMTDSEVFTASQESPPQLNEMNLRLPEGAENITNMKNALYAVKKICEELANEKSALAEEISVKNVALANFKAKEKEYLSLISGLKSNLEKVKEAAEEGTRAKRDLKILTMKLQEEAKVIEALKKSHEKMQEIVENYVLENDKLKAHVKIVKLESQKYNVLLAGKEAEIIKYKREIESFQKQITEQLSLLRSRATETEVQHTIEAISNQANILQKEDRTGQQDCDETLDSSSVKSQSIRKNKDVPPLDVADKCGWEYELYAKPSRSGNGIHRGGTDFTQRRSPPPEMANPTTDLDDLPSPPNLRTSIKELLRDIKMESPDVYWLSGPNSWMTSARSTSNLTTSEDVSDASPKD